MSFLKEIPALHGSLVRLEPLSAAHRADLAAAAEEDRGSFAFTEVPRATEVGAFLTAHSARGRGPHGAVRPDPAGRRAGGGLHLIL